MRKENIVYEGKIFQVVQFEVDEKGKTNLFEIARRSPGIRLIILTPDKKQVLLTKEFRHEHNSYDYRLPGGKVFDTIKEYSEFLTQGSDVISEAENAAKKEAREEVGIEVKNIKYFNTSVAGSTIQWDLIYFIVDDYEVLKEGQDLGNGEDIEIVPIGLEEAKELCLTMKEDRSAMMLIKFLASLQS